MNIKYTIIPIALTFFLGPGIGHLYLGKIKKGLALFGATVATAVFFFYDAIKASAKSSESFQNTSLILREFYAAHPQIVLYFDIVFACIWAYAFVDVFFSAPPVKSDEENTPEA